MYNNRPCLHARVLTWQACLGKISILMIDMCAYVYITHKIVGFKWQGFPCSLYKYPTQWISADHYHPADEARLLVGILESTKRGSEEQALPISNAKRHL